MIKYLAKMTGAAAILFLCSIAAFGQNDLKITTKNEFSGQSFQSTTYIKGSRQRTEQVLPGLNMSMATIEQCDLKRSIQLSEAAKKYLISEQAEVDESSSETPKTQQRPATPPPTKTTKGGVVTYIVNSTDTGERKQMFGYTARHIKSSMTTQSSPDACSKADQRIDTDGWYIDFSFAFSCPTTPVSRPMGRPSARGGCQDTMRFRNTGSGKKGFPLLETTTIYGPDGKPQTSITKEVTELSKATLDQALFEIPAGYTEAHDQSELYDFSAMARGSMGGGAGRTRPPAQSEGETPNILGGGGGESKSSGGTIRVGVVRLGNKTDQSLSTDSLRQHLISEISGSGIDAIALDSVLASEAPKEAKEKHCDFILYSDVATMKPASAAKKVGGILGRATGIGGGSSGKAEAQINFRLLPIDSLTPVIQSSASAKEEGDETTINSALDQEARQVVQAAQRKKQ